MNVEDYSDLASLNSY